MQNEQWNFDISEMTISSESSCSLSLVTATINSIDGITQEDGSVTGCGSSGILSPLINTVQFDPSNSDKVECANERDNPIVGAIDNEAEVKSEGGSDDCSNELVRLPGGMWRF